MKIADLMPWRTIAALRERIAYLEGRLEEISERAEEAEGRAFHRASEYYYLRNRQIEAQNQHLLRQYTEIANLTPLRITLPDMPSGSN